MMTIFSLFNLSKFYNFGHWLKSWYNHYNFIKCIFPYYDLWFKLKWWFDHPSVLDSSLQLFSHPSKPYFRIDYVFIFSFHLHLLFSSLCSPFDCIPCLIFLYQYAYLSRTQILQIFTSNPWVLCVSQFVPPGRLGSVSSPLPRPRWWYFVDIC